jgi:hypothetical protein
MNYIKRIGYVREKACLEIYIHSVQISLPLESSLQMVVKRNNNKKEKTGIVIHNQKLNIGYFDCTIVFPVTLYKSSNAYNSKVYYFRLLQMCNNKVVKNGKAKLDISTLLSNPLELKDLHLKNSTDPKACICLSANITKINKTFSCEQRVEEEKVPERNSNSFDIKSELKKQKSREKYLRRLEKVNNIYGSPQSAYIIKSDQSSCVSPNSPDVYDDSEDTTSIFAIKPILIQNVDTIEEKIESDVSSHHFKEEDIANGQFLDSNIDEQKEKKSLEEELSFEKETSPDFVEEPQKNPATSMESVEPNINSKENIEKIEIYSENSNKNCCKCMIF